MDNEGAKLKDLQLDIWNPVFIEDARGEHGFTLKQNRSIRGGMEITIRKPQHFDVRYDVKEQAFIITFGNEAEI